MGNGAKCQRTPNSMPQRKRRKRTMTAKARAALRQRSEINKTNEDMTHIAPTKKELAKKKVAKRKVPSSTGKATRKAKPKRKGTKRQSTAATTAASQKTPKVTSKAKQTKKKKKKKETRQGRVKPTFDIDSLSSTRNMGVLKRKDGKPSKKANPKRQWALVNGPLVVGENEPKLGETINCVGYGVYCWFERKAYWRKGQLCPAKREFRKLRCRDATVVSQQLAGELPITEGSIPKPKPKARRKNQSGSLSTDITDKISDLPKIGNSKPVKSPKKVTSPTTVSKKKPSKKSGRKTVKKTESKVVTDGKPMSKKRKRSDDLGDDSETDVESPREDLSIQLPAFKKSVNSLVTPVKVDSALSEGAATFSAHPNKRLKTKQLAWDQMDAYIGFGSADVGDVMLEARQEQNIDVNPLMSSFEIDQPPLMTQDSFDNLIDYLNDDTPLPSTLAQEESTTDVDMNDDNDSDKVSGIKFESGLAKLLGKGDTQFNREPYAKWSLPSFDDCGEADAGLDPFFPLDDEINNLVPPMQLARSISREMRNVAPWMQSAACRSYMSSK